MLIFHKVSWKNFLSTGNNLTEIDLDKHESTLVVGSRGSGKSTILDSLCFSLFNRAFRNIGKPQLINSINGKNLLVTVEFSIGSKRYKVIRGQKPNIFEIWQDNILLNQDAASRDYQRFLEDNILKLNFKSFTQIVILGSATFTPFMQLPLAHRREIIEDLLDIKIFSNMNAILKEKQSILKDDIQKVESDLIIDKEKFKIQTQYIKTLTNDKNIRIEEINKNIESTKLELTSNLATIATLNNTLESLKNDIKDSDKRNEQYSSLQSIKNQLNFKISDLNSEITFYTNNDSCPKCHQNLEHNHKNLSIENIKKKLEELKESQIKLDSNFDIVNKRISEIHNIKMKIREIETIIGEHNSTNVSYKRYIKRLEEELININSNNTNMDEEKSKIRNLSDNVDKLNIRRTELNEQKYYYDITSNLLKDSGIKTKIIRQYLPILNKIVNKYLSTMDFFISFELDESFNETIKSRHRDDFSYSNFSEGEKQSIDLALMLAFRTIAKMKNTCNTNLIILDEIFDNNMDVMGTDYFVDVLNNLGYGNVFVISHRCHHLYDKFRNVIKFEKWQNFSRIVENT